MYEIVVVCVALFKMLQLLSFVQMADVTWRDSLFTPLKERLTKALLRLVERDRSGEIIDANLIRDCVQCYGMDVR